MLLCKRTWPQSYQNTQKWLKKCQLTKIKYSMSDKMISKNLRNKFSRIKISEIFGMCGYLKRIDANQIKNIDKLIFIVLYSLI